MAHREMPRLKPIIIRDDGTVYDITEGPRQLDEQLIIRYPAKRTICARLLAECLQGTTFTDKQKTARFMVMMECRIGVKPISEVLSAALDRPGIELDEWKYLAECLSVLGRISSEESYAMLLKVIEVAKNVEFRADALEALAFGKRYVEPEFLYQFLEATQPVCLKLSGLNTIVCRSVISSEPVLVRNLIAQLLSDPDHMVRHYVIETLWFDPRNLDLILPLLSDPHPEVVKEAQYAVEMIRKME